MAEVCQLHAIVRPQPPLPNADLTLFNQPQSSGQLLGSQQGKHLGDDADHVGYSLTSEPQHHQAWVLSRWIYPNVGKVHIKGDEGSAFRPAKFRDTRIFGACEAFLGRGMCIVTRPRKDRE